MRILFLSIALLTALGAPLFAQSGEDAPPLAAAFAAIDDGDYDTAVALVSGQSQLAKDLVMWNRLRSGAGSFPEFERFAVSHMEWPGMDRLLIRAEESLTGDEPAARVLAFFGGRDPLTGEGAVALAAALQATGDTARAADVIRDAWLTLGMEASGHGVMMATHGAALAPYHAARVDMLLWRWRTTDAKRLLPLLDDDQRALADARIALIDKADNRDALVAVVPDALQNTPGLIYDRFNRLAGAGDWTDAVALLQAQSASADTLGIPWRWGSWRRILSRWLMREGRTDDAYALATSHGLTEGADFADLEWLAGYLALTYRDDPVLASRHFTRMQNAVTSPISLGRAGYWLGRAQDAAGDTDAAAAFYTQAAQHQTGFYGLLAAEKLGLSLDPALTGLEVFPDWQEAPFLIDDMTQAGLMLLAADERGLAVLFFADLGRTLDRSALAQLGDLLLELNEPFFALLVAKAGAERGIILPHIYFPLHDIAQMDLPVEPALVLSIARRESEFRTDAGSPVGALGLMQLMPGTAEDVAGELDLPYSRARLTSDYAYNALLGSKYLFNLRERFGDSPVMIAAGYNAGPSRPAAWMDERGDPRTGAVDVVDWIEHIPFRETRNYVMRVTETIPIYRARLTGEVGKVDFLNLLIGVKPLVRPVVRPASEQSEPKQMDDGEVSREPVAPAAPSSPTGPRPIARPGGG